jgi:DtxR family Mn-dependent transcriptional regulator
MLTQTEENYIKAIYNLEISNSHIVSTTLISNQLKTKASSVTDMLKKLAEKKLINYEKYKGASLTLEGKSIALKIVRKHRLWEVFLVAKLSYNWDEVHIIAEQLEHIKSDSLIDKLEEFLDFPTNDPHGDPIPDKEGNIEHHKNIMLSSVETEKSCVVIGIKNSSDSFLKFLDTVDIQIGTKLKVISKEEFDSSMMVENNNLSFSISNQISKNLFVKKL